jgi:hypothetical protein
MTVTARQHLQIVSPSPPKACANRRTRAVGGYLQAIFATFSVAVCARIYWLLATFSIQNDQVLAQNQGSNSFSVRFCRTLTIIYAFSPTYTGASCS